jgi:hypothetical protein
VSIQHFGLARDLGMETVGFLMMAHKTTPAELARQARIMVDAGAQCVLHRGVRAEAVRRRVAVHGVAGAEHPARRVLGGVTVVDRPQRGGRDLDRDRRVADQVVHDLAGGGLIDLWRWLVDVVTPGQKPLMPRADHADQAHPDAAEMRPRGASPSTGCSGGARRSD